ncbi:hypothetical protein PVAP13_5KG384814 [Panicum virgatum]|uniref:Uncharacterized protein n=1 Tax=Panicum virgatum TaxID=38727 RepID=A0A8T0SNR7_PANVG|nr:hypothetical protein PVAP13_5KG384814 [Panicum virgatum]
MAGARLQCTMLHAGAPARRLGLLQAHCSYSAHQGSANCRGFRIHTIEARLRVRFLPVPGQGKISRWKKNLRKSIG